MNNYRIFWMDGTIVRNGVVQAPDVVGAINAANSPTGATGTFISTLNGFVCGFPVVKVELLLTTSELANVPDATQL